MSATLRQSELFAGQTWDVIYRAFTEVNLNAYDFNTIRQSMKDYITRNYPEDYNDWIESSEFVILIDLISYIGQSLAFRMDLASRENFIDIARSKDSILRLARFLSYNPKRNYTSKGLVKLTQIKINEDIYDSSGNNLNNVLITWNDANNPNWYEQFILILNATLINTNTFGTPLKYANVNDIYTELYRFNNISNTPGNISFTSIINSTSLPFDIVNPDFDKNTGFTEKDPNPISAYHLIYRNDGNGNASINTGFFLLFKQGSLNYSDFNPSEPIENLVLDIDVDNINESDVWVQTVDDNGYILTDGSWTRVGYVPTDDLTKIVINSENVTYNSIPSNIQNLFQVNTRDNDQISIRFGDGRFGTIPTGNIRVWYRTSVGQYYTIKPEDIDNTQIAFTYYGSDNKQYNIGLGFSLQETIGNSTASETINDIRRRAGAVYSTQGRMVSGDDYNIFPITNNLAQKVKAINRVYSGQSRYIDLNDPTGSYQNTNVFSDDGCIYKDYYNSFDEVNQTPDITSEELVANYISPNIITENIKNFIYEDWLYNSYYNFSYGTETLWWQQSTNAIYSSTGRFAKSTSVPTTTTDWNNNRAALGQYANSSTIEQYITSDSMIKFKDIGWVTVSLVSSYGDSFKTSTEGQVVLNESINTGSQVLRILPEFRTVLSSDEITLFKSKFDDKKSFGIGYDYTTQSWYSILSKKINSNGDYDFSTKGSDSDSSWLIKCVYSSSVWRITTRGLRYIFESNQDVKFFFINTYKTINQTTGLSIQDYIKILSNNYNVSILSAKEWNTSTDYKVGDIIKLNDTNAIIPINQYNYYVCLVDHISNSSFSQSIAKLITTSNGYEAALVELWRNVSPSLGNEYIWNLDSNFEYDDGYIEPRRVIVKLTDSDNDGQPDNPESFYEIIDTNNFVFHERYTDTYGYTYYKLNYDIKYFNTNDSLVELNPNEVIYIYNTSTNNGIFYECLLENKGIPNINRLSEIAPLTDQSLYKANIGRTLINYQWKHYAPNDQRIDPAITNIIDIFVLTKEYYQQIQDWYNAGAIIANIPSSPTETELKISYKELEDYKMFSDEIIWRPVKFKLLFGNGAKDELKARFKVIKLIGTQLSDGEIKAQLINAINVYFNVASWDIGEQVFYWSELSSYIHTQLSNSVASVVIVPTKDKQAFGDLFEVRCLPDELFFPTATVDNVDIISVNTANNLRIKN